MMSPSDPFTDVVELCALLQCLGFNIKSLDTSDGNASQDGGIRTVVINCQASGLHVVLENPVLSCSCPTSAHQQNSGIWQVSGVTGGKPYDKEVGCSLLGSLPKSYRDRLKKELHDIIRCIKMHNDSDAEIPKETIANKSASLVELTTPEKLKPAIKIETPTRYRSLDTLVTASKKVEEQPLPPPGLLQRANQADASTDNKNVNNVIQAMCGRQSTYTLSSTSDTIRKRNKTSSPIKTSSQKFVLDTIMAAEKAVNEAHIKLTSVIRELMDDDDDDENNNSSISSFALDVSKISLLKVTDPVKPQFASSPNLANIENIMKEDLTKSTLKRFDSASTSNLALKKEKNISKLRHFSPSFFKSKLEITSGKPDKVKTPEVISKTTSLTKAKIVTPVRTPKINREASTSLSGSAKKKFSHVKSTIPRPFKKE